MKRLLALVFLILVFCFNSYAQTNSKHVKVKGYYRSDGTYVAPHYRTSPNSTNKDNFSTRGNINPYTREAGWVSPDSKLNYSSYSNSTTTPLLPNYPKFNVDDLYEPSKNYSIYVTTSEVKLLAEMSVTSTVKYVVPSNKEVKVIEKFFGDWWIINFNGKTGYSNTSALKLR